MQLGKFSTDRDSALHYLSTSEWANDTFGNVEAPTGFVSKISNNWEEVKPENTEMTSVLEDWFEQQGDVEDTPEFRESLVGHFLITENSQGFVYVSEFETAEDRDRVYNDLETEFNEWDDQGPE